MNIEELLAAAKQLLPGEHVQVTQNIGEVQGWPWAIHLPHKCLCGGLTPEEALAALPLAREKLLLENASNIKTLRDELRRLEHLAGIGDAIATQTEQPA